MSVRSDIGRGLALLSPDGRRRWWVLVVLQSGMALLDLAGVLLFGAVGVLAATAVQGSATPRFVADVLARVGVTETDPARLAALLGVVAAVFLVAKSLGNLALTRRMNRTLAAESVRVSSMLLAGLLSRGLAGVRSMPSQTSATAVGRSVNAAILTTLSAGGALVADIVLLVVLGGALVAIEPLLSLLALAYFGIVSVVVQRYAGAATHRAAVAHYEADVEGLTAVQDLIGVFREITLVGRFDQVTRSFLQVREVSAGQRARQLLYSQVPRAVFEAALIMAAVGLTLVTFLTRDIDEAIATLALFLVATARVLPSLVRLNSAHLTVRGAAGEAQAAFRLADLVAAPGVEAARSVADPPDARSQSRGGGADIGTVVRLGSGQIGPQREADLARGVARGGSGGSVGQPAGQDDANAGRGHGKGRPLPAGSGATTAAAASSTLDLTDRIGMQPLAIDLEGVCFSYPEAAAPAVAKVSISLPVGRRMAIVGTSGAGKSTLVDLILGLLQPDAGRIALSGEPPADLIARCPGTVGYVPQDVHLVSGTVRDNVALALGAADAEDELVWEALGRASLVDLVRTRQGLDTVVGERGIRLSGGQRQRLGLARALYTRPGLLVLDEATSALDADTEAAIGEALAALGSEVTVVTVAHRLSTVRQADLVVYLESGRVRAAGDFGQVRARVPDFDRQAQLMGL